MHKREYGGYGLGCCFPLLSESTPPEYLINDSLICFVSQRLWLSKDLDDYQDYSARQRDRRPQQSRSVVLAPQAGSPS